MITITYRRDGMPTTAIEINHKDVGTVLEMCRKRIYPDVDPPLRDLVWERALARVEGGLAPTPVHKR